MGIVTGWMIPSGCPDGRAGGADGADGGMSDLWRPGNAGWSESRVVRYAGRFMPGA